MMQDSILDMLEHEDPFWAALVICQQLEQDVDIDHYHLLLDSLVEQCRIELSGKTDLSAFKSFVSLFYRELLFSAPRLSKTSPELCLMNHVLELRQGMSVSLAIVFSFLARRLGFDVHGINFPGHFLLCWQQNATRQFYLDPLNGNLLSYEDLEKLYFAIVDEDEFDNNLLTPCDTKQVIVRLLNNLKVALMDEQHFSLALQCSDLLIALCPDDPYERRDRGFLLHQLNCFQVALADYRHFIKECPTDPAAQILKLQLKHLQPLPVVFH
ncbi:SirB1 family protein [Neptunicella marina]|uniref:Tetratricopeptide repeat protein n=1 Tax=Neptunicella marina TaxID=2125989 RepID=A0A8J6IPG3_9ALTE|nr:tetratricopeptide repeat protein [Neptunicella marina]MBC3764359.1 tetratricopeptide repeat protein [Neptunicella marina]